MPFSFVVPSSVQSFSSNSCFRFLMQNLHTKYVTTAMTKIPPTTPPAMGPAAEPEFDEGGGDELTAAFFTHEVEAHLSQLAITKEHDSSAAQFVGHAGVVLGH